MGNSEAGTPTKSNKDSSPVQEQPSIHPYPEWASMQAYYGPGVPVPPPYLAAAVASGHAPHPYMWGPQPFMPPYGTPYSAIYTHGVYSHPSVPLESHSHCQGIAPSTTTNEAVVMATPLSMEPLTKSTSNKGRGLLKKLKGLDGQPVSNGNCTADDASGGAAHGLSHSVESGTEGSSDGSDGSSEQEENKTQGSSEDIPTSAKDGKAVTPGNAVYGGETNESSKIPLSNSTAGKPVDARLSPSPTLGAESRVSANGEVKATPVPPATTTVVKGRDGVSMDHWMQDERALKRERRKQSNRESARRSRLRKQAETEELALKLEALGSENMTLKTEIIRLREDSDKLRVENSALMEKLKDGQLSQAEDPSFEKVESQGPLPITTENFLSRVNNPNPHSGREKPERETHGSSSSKLHQLLGPSSRTDALAAG